VPFRAILQHVAVDTERVRGVVFCDELGERVAHVALDPKLDAYELDVTGASFAHLVPRLLEQSPRAQMRVMLGDNVVWVAPLPNGYYVVVLAPRGAGDMRLPPALVAVLQKLQAEM
jgi:hypothetical protein